MWYQNIRSALFGFVTDDNIVRMDRFKLLTGILFVIRLMFTDRQQGLDYKKMEDSRWWWFDKWTSPAGLIQLQKCTAQVWIQKPLETMFRLSCCFRFLPFSFAINIVTGFLTHFPTFQGLRPLSFCSKRFPITSVLDLTLVQMKTRITNHIPETAFFLQRQKQCWKSFCSVTYLCVRWWG